MKRIVMNSLQIQTSISTLTVEYQEGASCTNFAYRTVKPREKYISSDIAKVAMMIAMAPSSDKMSRTAYLILAALVVTGEPSTKAIRVLRSSFPGV
jgi:hypothetical protein